MAVKKKGNITWPLTSEEFHYRICNRPLSDIYNVICFSIYESSSINQYEYATTSHIKARRIWSLAGDWEGLITKQSTPKHIVLGMVFT